VVGNEEFADPDRIEG